MPQTQQGNKLCCIERMLMLQPSLGFAEAKCRVRATGLVVSAVGCVLPGRKRELHGCNHGHFQQEPHLTRQGSKPLSLLL